MSYLMQGLATALLAIAWLFFAPPATVLAADHSDHGSHGQLADEVEAFVGRIRYAEPMIPELNIHTYIFT